MGYLKLKKEYGAFDLIPSENIMYVIGSEGTVETGAAAGDGTSPFVRVVYMLPASTTKAFASKIVLGADDQVLATTTAGAIMQSSVNDAILNAMQQPGAIVAVDFSKMSTVVGYIGDGTVASAAPVEYALLV